MNVILTNLMRVSDQLTRPGRGGRVSRLLRSATLATVLLACGLMVASCSSEEAEPTMHTGTSESGSAPTGPWIAFQWLAGGGDGIYVVQSDGDHSRQIVTDVPGEAIHPSWSPDGTMLAFVVQTQDGGGVWVADADGEHAHVVAKCSGDCLFYDHAVWVPGHDDQLLMVRDDGPTLDDSPVPGSSVLELLDLDTGKGRVVVTSERLQLFSGVSVSPDGKQFCAGVEIGDTGNGISGSAIVVGDMAGGGATMVTDPKEYAAYCDWRPQGNEFVYTTYDLNVFPDMSEDSNLYLVAPDGSNRRQLTHFTTGEKRATQPRWTPDGNRIVFTLVQGDGHTRQMATVSSDGGDLQWATGSEPQPGTHPVLQLVD